MPELPEVETIRRGLDNFIKSKKLYKVSVLCEKSFVGEADLVVGASVTGLRRRGKALLIDFDNGYTLMVHLRMTGQLIFRFALDPFLEKGVQPPKTSSSSKSRACCDFDETNDGVGFDKVSDNVRFDETNSFAGGHPSDNFEAELPNKQTRVCLEFEDGVLYFNDQRKFGFIKVILTREVEQDSFIAALGPEPWEMKVEELAVRLKRHGKSPVKAVLLDQKVIAGLGNIYADETCYYAGVKPERKCADLTEAEIERLLEGARVSMERSIDSGGSTMATYRKADGTKGDYLEKFAEVFHREGQQCRRCGETIIKTRVAGRGTHYCPGCQK